VESSWLRRLDFTEKAIQRVRVLIFLYTDSTDSDDILRALYNLKTPLRGSTKSTALLVLANKVKKTMMSLQ